MASFSLQEWSLSKWTGEEDLSLSLYVPDYQAAENDPDFEAWWIDANSAALLDGLGGVYGTNGGALSSNHATIRTQVMPGAKQYVSAQLDVKTIPGGGTSWAGVSARVTQFTSGTNYALIYDTSLPGWRLCKQIAGVVTTLATYTGAGQVVTAGNKGSCVLICVGDQITAVTNGVEHTPVTDAAIAGPGACGIFLATQGGATPTTGLHIGPHLAAWIP